MAKGLEALLGATTDLKEEIYIPRLKTSFTIRALDDDAIEKARAQATTGRSGEVDGALFNRGIIARGTIDPEFNAKELRDVYEASDAVDCVGKALLPGEQARIFKAILALSGFVGDDDLIEDAKN
ncbi:phage tail assembly chaperone [Paenibacillus peoriae]|uniref:phage tail assembly chaperone n=1 Tax=Paenibacillus peoriae TaxID=59893 RepID=UPI003F979FEB